MSAQVEEQELHAVSVKLTEDFTDSVCAVCGPLEHALAVAHGADHAVVTGHTVTESHVRVIVISETT